MAHPRRFPTTLSNKVSLLVVTVVYTTLGMVALCLRGHEWKGDTATLTTILAILGAGLTVLSRTLLASSQDAGLQMLGSEAVERDVSVQKLHRREIAIRGGMSHLLGRPFNGWAWTYKVFLPGLAIATSALFKKTFGPGIKLQPVAITGTDAVAFDPTIVIRGIPATAFAGVTIKNITTSSSSDPSETSWPYLLANISDGAGIHAVEYYLPSLPRIVLARTSGYVRYNAELVPALTASVQCSDQFRDMWTPGPFIINSDNNITVGSTADGTAIMQVDTSAHLTWFCLSTLSKRVGTFTFQSDSFGNWNVSDVTSLTDPIAVPFETTEYRWGGMPGELSGALGTAAALSGWDWTTSTADSGAYSTMVLTSRLSLAVSTLSLSYIRASEGPKNTSGQAYEPQLQIVLLTNWALSVTVCLLFIQAIIPFVLFWSPGGVRIDFGILQIMEMRAAAIRGSVSSLRLDDGSTEGAFKPDKGTTGEMMGVGAFGTTSRAASDPAILVDYGVATLGYCTGFDKDSHNDPNLARVRLAIKSDLPSGGHVALVQSPPSWYQQRTPWVHQIRKQASYF